MKALFLFSFFIILHFQSFAQIHYGAHNFTEYRRGTLPIIISVPHGGLLAPDSIPDRTCNNPTTVTDAKTIELALRIDSSFYELTGCHIHLVICNLKRTKVDCNRNLVDGACNQTQAIGAWNDFHDFIDSAQNIALAENNNKAFYIDLHGHGKAQQRLELGYLLNDHAYEQSDSLLNTNMYINKSSLKNLVSTNVNNSSHAQLLRGDFALGTILGNAGFPSVPSKQIPKPDTTSNYFDGGYNTENYTSKAPGNIVNGLQIECNNTGVRDNAVNRKRFADSLARALINYLSYHQNILFTNCQSIGIENTKSSNFILFPNPASNFISLKKDPKQVINTVEILNAQGISAKKIEVVNNAEVIEIPVLELSNGFYLLRISSDKGISTLKFYINR
jgi:N-formylglutamate amidohydrolase